jgi:hypothetical protein
MRDDVEVTRDTVRFEECEVLRETEKALLVRIDGDEVWLPKSQLIDYEDETDVTYIVMPRWLADAKELNYD